MWEEHVYTDIVLEPLVEMNMSKFGNLAPGYERFASRQCGAVRLWCAPGPLSAAFGHADRDAEKDVEERELQMWMQMQTQPHQRPLSLNTTCNMQRFIRR